ncbi:hypothetical protein SRHO_G00105220 [Serrasalmus rhombeus]
METDSLHVAMATEFGLPACGGATHGSGQKRLFSKPGVFREWKGSRVSSSRMSSVVRKEACDGYVIPLVVEYVCM